MKLFVFMQRKGAVACYGIIAEDYNTALKIGNLREEINDKKYPLELEITFELKDEKRKGTVFSIEE